MREIALLMLLVTTSLAGCVDDGTTSGRNVATVEPDDPMGPVVDETGRVVSAPAPTWRPGDWWTWTVTPRDHEPYEVTTSVAAIEGDAYVIGWSDIEAGLRSQFFHFVPHGLVQRADLSWEAHNEPVRWLDFPLEDGKAWEGSLWLADMAFNATYMEGETPMFVIRGSDEGGGVRVEMDWSVTSGIFTSLRFYLHDDEPWLALRLDASGMGRTEPIHVLRSTLVIQSFFTLQGSVGGSGVPPVARSLEVPSGVTHISIGCYAGGAAGYYGFTLTGPDATRYGCERQASTETSTPLLLDWGPVEPGSWVSSMHAVGQGSVFVEVHTVRAETVTAT